MGGRDGYTLFPDFLYRVSRILVLGKRVENAGTLKAIFDPLTNLYPPVYWELVLNPKILRQELKHILLRSLTKHEFKNNRHLSTKEAEEN